jgi:hypothetical protein
VQQLTLDDLLLTAAARFLQPPLANLAPTQFWRSVRAVCHRLGFLEDAEHAQHWNDFYNGKTYKPPAVAGVGVVFDGEKAA